METERNVNFVNVLARLLRTKASAARRPHGRWTSAPPVSVAQPSLPADPSLPQLEVARDPELMREVFQRHLRPLDKKTYRIRECRISRTRHHDEHYMPQQYLLYTLVLEEPDKGRELTQWVTGVIHAKAGRTRQEWERLRVSEPERAIPGATSSAFEPYAYVPELEMLVQVFPHDHRLPGLPFLMAGPLPELEPLLLARFGEGDWQTEAWDMEPVRYLPGKRITLRLTVRAREGGSGREEERRFYAKVYRKEEDGEQIYRVLQALWDKASAGGAGFTVGGPVAYLSDLRTLVQEEIHGTCLRNLLLEKDEATPVVRRAARALAALHLDDEVPTPRRSRPWKEIFDEKVKNAEKALRRACPRLEPEIGEIVGAVVAGLEKEGPVAPTHHDLHLRHILLDDDRPALIDFDAFSRADPLLDVANVLSLIRIMPLNSSLSQDRAREAVGAFAEEYFAHVPEAWRERFPLHYAGALLKRAAGLSKRREPSRLMLDEIEDLVGEAEGSLKGGVW
ncbi:MAG: phosphotransferase [Rubrobacter sp.]|nr:phosphotransferase [Rubrobacter sp.]